MKEQLLEELKLALLDMDGDAAVCLARRIMMAEIPPLDAIRFSMMSAMEIISEQFDEGELFVPQMLLAADAFERTMEVVSGGLASDDGEGKKRAEVYTVEGDIHDIGKNLVASVLRANGFQVLDLGRSVSAEQAVSAAREWKPDVIIGFALMTTTFPAQKELIDILEEQNIRNQFCVLVGGSMASPQWASRIGADGYASNAFEAVRLMENLLDGTHQARVVNG